MGSFLWKLLFVGLHVAAAVPPPDLDGKPIDIDDSLQQLLSEFPQFAAAEKAAEGFAKHVDMLESVSGGFWANTTMSVIPVGSCHTGALTEHPVRRLASREILQSA
jgi:hypothetical protein